MKRGKTKLGKFSSIFRPIVVYESERLIDSDSIMQELELADMKVLRLMKGVFRNDQWGNRMTIDSICKNWMSIP